MTHASDEPEGRRLVQPMREIAEPVLARCGRCPTRYRDGVLRAGAAVCVYTTGRLLRAVPPDAVEALLDVAGPDADLPVAVV